MPVFAAAREFMERALAAAECRHDRKECRVIAERIIQVVEAEDFDECRRLQQPNISIASDADSPL